MYIANIIGANIDPYETPLVTSFQKELLYLIVTLILLSFKIFHTSIPCISPIISNFLIIFFVALCQKNVEI